MPDNTSTIEWTLTLTSSSDGAINSSAPKAWSVTVNGTKYSGTNYIGVNNNSSKTLATGATVVSHDEDGTKTFSYSFNQQFDINFNGWVGTITGSGSGELNRINRASRPSCITWPEHTQNVGNFGDTISIHMNRQSSDFTHTVKYRFGKQEGTIATGVTTGTTWTIPKSLMNLIPNSLSGSGTIIVDTYLGSEKIGAGTCGFTATVPNTADCSPTCKFTLEDTAGWDKVYGSPVQGLSIIKMTINPILAYSSPIASYAASMDGVNYTEATATSGALKNAGDSLVTATIKDGRGRSGSASYTMKVQAYNGPSVSKLTVHRCNADGTENEQGEYIKATFSALITALGNKNTAAYKLRYKKSSETMFTEVTLSNLANAYAPNDSAYIFAADSNSSYDVEIEAKDRHGTATRSTSASTAFTLMNWGTDGTSMGIGKVAEKANTLQIGLDTEFIGKVTGAIFDAILPVGSMVMRYDHINPSTLYPGTTWARVYGAFPWFTDDKGQIGLTGGERTVTLTESQMPTHDHGGTYTNGGTATKTHAWLASGGSAMTYEAVEAGGGEAHNNMPPYIQVAAWRRTA